MEIGIFGCDHAFGRGIEGPITLYGVSDNNAEAISLAREGYPAVLSKLYPQHNFEVVPILDGGTREIINSLMNYIIENPKDLYIVQTTQWHRATIGGLHYKKKLYNVTDNLAYKLYDPRSYHMERYQDIHHCHYPNYNISKKPGQPFMKVRGTFNQKYVWLLDTNTNEPGVKQTNQDGFIPKHFKQALPFWEATGMVLIHDHLASFHHLHDIYAAYNTMHYLSQKENIWYFFWNPPFGNALDLIDYLKPEKDKFLKEQGLLHAKFMNRNQKKLITTRSIYDYFGLDTNKIEEDNALHLPREAHEKIVELLLSNKEFKTELDK